MGGERPVEERRCGDGHGETPAQSLHGAEVPEDVRMWSCTRRLSLVFLWQRQRPEARAAPFSSPPAARRLHHWSKYSRASGSQQVTACQAAWLCTVATSSSPLFLEPAFSLMDSGCRLGGAL